MVHTCYISTRKFIHTFYSIQLCTTFRRSQSWTREKGRNVIHCTHIVIIAKLPGFRHKYTQTGSDGFIRGILVTRNLLEIQVFSLLRYRPGKNTNSPIVMLILTASSSSSLPWSNVQVMAKTYAEFTDHVPSPQLSHFMEAGGGPIENYHIDLIYTRNRPL